MRRFFVAALLAIGIAAAMPMPSTAHADTVCSESSIQFRWCDVDVSGVDDRR